MPSPIAVITAENVNADRKRDIVFLLDGYGPSVGRRPGGVRKGPHGIEGVLVVSAAPYHLRRCVRQSKREQAT